MTTSVRVRRSLAVVSAAALLFSGVVVAAPAASAETVQARSFALVGSLQSELGCPADWAPECAETELAATGDRRRLRGGVRGPRWQLRVQGRRRRLLGRGLRPRRRRRQHPADGRRARDAPIRLRRQHAPGRRSRSSASHGRLLGRRRRTRRGSRSVRRARQAVLLRHDRPLRQRRPLERHRRLTGDRLATGFDPTDKGFYNGGDIAGLRSKLDYIEGLGTTAIWLTPSFANKPVQGTGADASAGYHGYWVTDFTQIDPHLGTNAELEALIDDAQRSGHHGLLRHHHQPHRRRHRLPRGRVLLHRPGDRAVPRCRRGPSSTPPPRGHGDRSRRSIPRRASRTRRWSPMPSRTSRCPRGSTTRRSTTTAADSTWSGESTTYGDFSGLDDLMTEHPAVVNGFVDVYEDWIDLGIDGFRIDTAKHVNFEFWQTVGDAACSTTRTRTASRTSSCSARSTTPTRSSSSPYVRKTDMNSVLDFTFQSSAVELRQGRLREGAAEPVRGR